MTMTEELEAAIAVLANHSQACNKAIDFQRVQLILYNQIGVERRRIKGTKEKSCDTCAQFSPVKTGSALGFCTDSKIQKLITDLNARNCDGFNWKRKESIVIDNGDNGVRL